MSSGRRALAGFALYEAMISILVVSFGFLGFVGLQTKGLANANSSLLRSKAVSLGYQIADRARANLPAAQAGAYNLLEGTPNDPGCIATGCTTAQIVQSDYAEWRADIAAALPSGAGMVCVDSTPEDGSPDNAQCDGVGSTLAIKIWWTEKKVQYRFSSSFRP
jgi:type IV pilus assembly protein PilV